MSVRVPSSPAQARQQLTHQRVRREILLAAAGVFARHGYAAATLADLAEAAGYAPPSLYRYFESKEEIFSSLTDLLKGELAATFELPVDRSQPLQARLVALVGAQFALVRERREVFAVLLSTRPSECSGPAPLADVRAGLAIYEAQMTAWLRRHAARRELRCPVELAARALSGLSHAFHHGQVHGAVESGGPDVLARRVVDLALHGISAVPSASSS
jgi:AcrR family transcriptional regulator